MAVAGLVGMVILAVVLVIVGVKRFDRPAAVPESFAPPGNLPTATALGADTLAFDSDRTGNFEIFAASIDGDVSAMCRAAGGWAVGDESFRDALEFFTAMRAQLEGVLPYVETIVSTPEGRRGATQFITVNYEHIPADLIEHQIVGAATAPGVIELVATATDHGWSLDPEKITCPVRIVWGTEDRILTYPRTAARFRNSWLPNADWVELEGVGHCPQLDVPAETAQLILGFTDN